MAFFRRKRAVRFGSRRFRRGRSPYETVQLSLCRRELETGLSSCSIPDQFFIPLITGRDFLSPFVTSAALTSSNSAITFAAQGEKGVIVKGIEFDYFFSYIPDGSEEAPALGVTSIRYGLVVMDLAPAVSDVALAAPDSPSPNIFFHSEALRRDSDWGGGFNATEELKKYRILWRGMRMARSIIINAAAFDQFTQANYTLPNGSLMHYHQRVRASCRLGMNQGLFFVVEMVNPFLDINPTFAVDLLGKCGVKRITRGNSYEA